mgnify:CR=1 FL=1
MPPDIGKLIQRLDQSSGLVASFAEPDFRKVWFGAVLFALGMWIERLAIGWFVLDQSGSVFLAALSFAIRTVPNLILGPIGGVISDRVPRTTVLMVTSIVRMSTAVSMALVVFFDFATIPILLVLVCLTGSTIAFWSTALLPLQTEIVGQARLGNAISLTSFGQRAIGLVGALAGGILLAWLGPAATLLISAAPLAAATIIFSRVHQPDRAPRTETRFTTDLLDGFRLIFKTPMVRLLLGVMIVVEIFGFSFHGLLPAVAERILEVGPERLGVITGSVSVGAMLGTLLLVLVADRLPRGLMLITVFATFGSLIIVLGNSTIFWLSVVAAAGIGASAAIVDALEWIMLQDSVPETLRGRALGYWNFAIGWGWIGPITLGAIADATSVSNALTFSGAVLAASAVIILVSASSLRQR